MICTHTLSLTTASRCRLSELAGAGFAGAASIRVVSWSAGFGDATVTGARFDGEPSVVVFCVIAFSTGVFFPAELSVAVLSGAGLTAAVYACTGIDARS